MYLKKRIFAVLAVVCLGAAAIYGSTGEMSAAGEAERGLSLFGHKDTIYFWYSDDTLTDYINSAAVSFGEERGVRVLPKLTSHSEYLEELNQASLHSEQIPDAYMISNDSLEKAYLAGLASEIEDEGGICNETNFPAAALSAVSYKGKMVAYPLFYETSALVYNETYLEEWSKQQAKISPEEGDVLLEGEALEAKAAEYMASAIPATMDDILNVADTFDVPEGVEGIMKWDVSDIFYNYWFVGNYMIIGGDPGDDAAVMDIDNQETIQCLEVYKALNQFFSMESDTIDYDSVVGDFIDGKMVFTIATTDIVDKLSEAKASGRLDFEYGIAPMPEVSEELESRSLSVTNAIAVNGYSTRKELANEFAAYLTDGYVDKLYEKSGRFAANQGVNQDNGAMQIFMQEYAESVPLPKLIETSNFWLQLEILFSKVWNGADVAEQVSQLAGQVVTQVQAVTE